MNQFIGILLSGILLTSPITLTSTLPGQYSCTVQVEVDEPDTSENTNHNSNNKDTTSSDDKKDSETTNKETITDNKNEINNNKENNKNQNSDDKDSTSTKEEIKTEIETIITPEQNVIVPPTSISSTIQESSSSSNGNSSSSHKSSSNSSAKNESLNEIINHLPTEEEMLANTNANISNTNSDTSQKPTEILVDEVTNDTDSNAKIEKFHFSDTVRMGIKNVINFGTLTFEKIMYTIRTYIQDEPAISWAVLILLIICITLYIKLISEDKKQKDNEDIKKNEIEECE